MYELLPCPCCAAQAHFYVNELYKAHAVYIECSDCGIGTPEFSYETPEEYEMLRSCLTKMWNRRQDLLPITTCNPRRICSPKTPQGVIQ